MNQSKRINTIDWVTLLLYFAIASIGIAFIYATTYSPANPSFFQFDTSYGRQSVWLGISVVVGAVILIIDAKFYTSFAYILYGLIMLLLLSVLFLGVEINGSKSWFALGPIRFQPAELAKFATCIGLAKYFTELNVNMEKWTSKWRAGLFVAVPVGLILLQGDVGSALVFFSLVFVLHREGLESAYLIIGFGLIIFSLLALLYSSFALIAAYAAVVILIIFYNKKRKYPLLESLAWLAGIIATVVLYNLYIIPLLGEIPLFLPLAILFTIVVFIGGIVHYKRKSWLPLLLGGFLMISAYTYSIDYIFNNIFKQHHRDRINLILGKIEDQSGAGYNLFQSKIAIGSGGWFGKGYLEGTQTMFNFVPEQSTDFIFTSIAEEMGFFGSFVLIALFVALLVRIIFIAERQRSRFARVYGYGVASILFFHFAINIAMTIGLAPVIGIPLPFVSYGGSSLLAFSILLFVLLKLDTQRLNVFR